MGPLTHLTTAATLQSQLEAVVQKKKLLQAAMRDLQKGVEAIQPPSAIPPHFVTLHIPKRDECSTTTADPALGAMKPAAEKVTETEVPTMSGAPTAGRSSITTRDRVAPTECRSNGKRSEHVAKPTNENKRQQGAISPSHDGREDEPSSSAKKSRISLPLPLQIEQLRIEADRLHISGQLEQAGDAYISAINLSGPWTERSMHASLHFNYAVCLIRQERYEEAITHATEAAKLEPTFAGAHYALGFAVGKGGKDMQQSMRAFNCVLKLKPKIRLTLPNGTIFGPKEQPLLTETDFLIVYQRRSCATLKIPPEWTVRESRSQPGKIFFENIRTRATQWVLPTEKKKNFMSLNDILAASGISSTKRSGKKGGVAPMRQKAPFN